MKSFQSNRGFRNILHSRPVLVLFGILVLIFALGVIRFMNKMELTRENRKIVENKVKLLEQQKEKLLFDVAKLNTDQGIEESIREKFGLVKEGEGVIVVTPNQDKEEVKETKPSGFFSSLFFWKNWFK